MVRGKKWNEWLDAVDESVAVEPSGEFQWKSTIAWRWSEAVIECPKRFQDEFTGKWNSCKGTPVREYEIVIMNGTVAERAMYCPQCREWFSRPLGIMKPRLLPFPKREYGE